MVKRCIYCSCEISEGIPIDVCRRCGIGVWGEKMFKAICEGMTEEKKKGNMELGRVGEKEMEEMRELESKPEIFVEREIISARHEDAHSADDLDIEPRPIEPSEFGDPSFSEMEDKENNVGEVDPFVFN